MTDIKGREVRSFDHNVINDTKHAVYNYDTKLIESTSELKFSFFSKNTEALLEIKSQEQRKPPSTLLI